MSEEIVSLPTAELRFDTRNPRLAEYGITESISEKEILKLLWTAMDVQEIVQSIAASGFFPHEALIVAKEGGNSVVIEGNRRLAALKVLLDPSIAEANNWTVEEIPEKDRKKLREVPCVISTREDAWRYLGFKHVNGPAKWTSYAKASYIAKVHAEFDVPLAKIAQQIGDRHKTVQRLYRGWMVLEQAEKEGVYRRDDRWNKNLAFSHLYTGLDKIGIRAFLSISSTEEENDNPVPRDKLDALGELLVWLYGSRQDKKHPVIRSQNPDLKNLDKVVASREAIAALRQTSDLETAYEISRPSNAVFEEALLASKRHLQTARAHLTTGYESSKDLLRIAGTVAKLADDLYDEMERKLNSDGKKRRLTEDD